MSLENVLTWANCDALDHFIIGRHTKEMFGHVRLVEVRCVVCGKVLREEYR